MEQFYNDVGLSIYLLKFTGIILLFIGVIYFYKFKPIFLPIWKKVFVIGCLIGAINSGLVLSFGNAAYFLTPTILVFFVMLYYFNKFPLYKFKHLLGLLASFVFSSVIFFIGIAGTFFHLAVEGEI